ncbi:hypothetical protein ACWJJH_16730 [Endozoicomonadaceae bacterium StTr2]
MSDTLYALVFKGELRDGVDISTARQQLQKLFRTTAEKVDGMFTGQPVILKHGLNKETAEKYQAALLKAGAVCDIKLQKTKAKIKHKSATETNKQPPSPTHPQGTSDWELMPPGTRIGEPKPAHFIEPDTGHLDISPQQGYIVEQNQTPAPPPPDTSHLALELR